MRTQEQVRRDLERVEKEINSEIIKDPGMSAWRDRRRSWLLKELQKVQMRDWNL